MDFYLSKGNDTVYACSLELSKAFDKVSFYKLFCKLLDMDVPTYIIQFLEAWCTHHSLQIKWQNELSEPLGVRNGVRQVSVLSPLLFNIYLDNLLKSLEKSNFGARIGNLYVGCIVYAESITNN